VKLEDDYHLWIPSDHDFLRDTYTFVCADLSCDAMKKVTGEELARAENTSTSGKLNLAVPTLSEKEEPL